MPNPGVQTTLDDSPPSFTKLHIDDPTEFNTRIIVTFALNEAGTAYCRATRVDSGETAADMPLNRIPTHADVVSGMFSCLFKVHQNKRGSMQASLSSLPLPVIWGCSMKVYCF